MTMLLRKMWKNHSKHKKLCEEWALAECEGEGWWREARDGKGNCEVRYAGNAPVDRASSAPATASAVRSALHTAKTLNKKLQRVNLDISSKGILVSDADSQENVLSVSIYKISYCSADAANARVFAVVEGKSAGADETHVVHVFVCARRKQARALALSLAHSFNDAYQTPANLGRLDMYLLVPNLTTGIPPIGAWQANEAALMKSGGRRLVTPWVHFPDESEEETDNEQWDSPTPLVTFA